MNKQRVAIVGSGISGLATAWLLKDRFSVTLFESNIRVGGHTHSYTVHECDRAFDVDTGFMVFNRPNYPLLSALFDHLGVHCHPTDMSFSVSLDNGALEYSGSSLRGLFAQPGNLASPGFLGMLRDIIRFNRAARAALDARDQAAVYGTERVGQFLQRQRLGQRFRDHYLYPMAAAIWSCPPSRVDGFPLISFARFLNNHGLLDLYDRPQWQTPVGGASTYVRRLLADLPGRVRTGSPVEEVRRRHGSVQVRLEGGPAEWYDQVVLACHSDQAARLLHGPTAGEAALLNSVSYQPNQVWLHRDPRLMPQRRSAWSSWNYLGYRSAGGDPAVSVSYWMNALQSLPTENDYFVSLNPLFPPADEAVVARMEYSHPMFDHASLGGASLLRTVQGRDRVWFCGAWTGYGFHEDGLRSAVQVAQALGADLPWESEQHNRPAARSIVDRPRRVA